MVIKTQLSRDQFMMLSFWQHISRQMFFFFAITCGAVTIYVMLQGGLHLFLVAWIPLVVYLFMGLVNVLRESSLKDHPVYLPTEYTFSETGVTIANARAESALQWDDFTGWKRMVNCYVLLLPASKMIAIPQPAVAPHQVDRFEKMLHEYLGEKK